MSDDLIAQLRVVDQTGRTAVVRQTMARLHEFTVYSVFIEFNPRLTSVPTSVPPHAPPHAPTLRELALRYLRERITSGDLAPGARLSDLLLAKEIGISRTPVREAIQQLAADGLVDVIPHQGAVVHTPSPEELDELYEIRSILEGHAAARTATRRTDADVAELRGLCAAMEAIPTPAMDAIDATATAEQRRIDLTFHQRVLAMSGQRQLQRMVEDAGIIARPFETMAGLITAEALASAIAHHRRVTDAIADGDAERARQMMTDHIEDGRHGAGERRLAWQTTRSERVPAALRPFLPS